jgi:hypothetical protein
MLDLHHQDGALIRSLGPRPPERREHGLWRKIAGMPRDRIIRIPPRTISGRWATAALAGPAPKSSSTMATISGRPSGLSGRGWRPVRRDLEQRLHAI